MSAYIVGREHIAYLVCAAMSRKLTPYGGGFRWTMKDEAAQWGYRHETLHAGDLERAVEVANMLWRENIASVSHRYPNESSATLPGPCNCDFVIVARDLPLWWSNFTSAEVLKACDCYEYQSCEHPGWEASEACAFIRSLRSAAWHTMPGYEDAPWGAPENFGKQHRRAVA